MRKTLTTLIATMFLTLTGCQNDSSNSDEMRREQIAHPVGANDGGMSRTGAGSDVGASSSGLDRPGGNLSGSHGANSGATGAGSSGSSGANPTREDSNR